MNIFLAAPFTQLLDAGSGLITGPQRQRIEGLIEWLEGDGHVVVSSRVREDWGKRLEPPDQALAADMASLKEADVLVAFLGDPPSPGVQMELGAAIAWRKRVLVLVEAGKAIPYLVGGLHEVTDATVAEFGDDDDLLRYVRRFLVETPTARQPGAGSI